MPLGKPRSESVLDRAHPEALSAGKDRNISKSECFVFGIRSLLNGGTHLGCVGNFVEGGSCTDHSDSGKCGCSEGCKIQRYYPHLVVYCKRNDICNDLRLSVLQTQQPLVLLHQQENLIVVQDANVGLCQRRYSTDEKGKCTSNEHDPITIVIPNSFAARLTSAAFVSNARSR